MSGISDAQDTREQTVYRCYDEAGQLLYIGCTGDLDYRMTLHDPLVIAHVDRIVTEEYPDRLTGRAAERAAIKAEAPLLNKQHNPTRFAGKRSGGFVPVEPIHPLTAQMVYRDQHVVTMDEKRAALATLAQSLGLEEREDAS